MVLLITIGIIGIHNEFVFIKVLNIKMQINIYFIWLDDLLNCLINEKEINEESYILNNMILQSLLLL